METNYKINVMDLDGRRVINFTNDSSQFVEVIIAVNGREVREGRMMDTSVKGFGFPPRLEKPVRMMKDGTMLNVKPGSTVKAYVFSGFGSYGNLDLDMPTFLRNRLADKIKFQRTSDEPVAVLELTA